MGPKVLVDSVQSTDHLGSQPQTDLPSSMPITREILVTGMGVKQSRPILFARFDEELFIYEAFPFYETQVDNHLKLRFKKFTNHNILVKEPKFYQQSDAETTNKEQALVFLPQQCVAVLSRYLWLFGCIPLLSISALVFHDI